MQAESPFRVGQGFDVHRFAEGRRLIIGGVQIEHPLGLEGHSDADVLAHAIGDALLGAANLGDLGAHFPDTDVKYKDASSLDLLQSISNLLEKSGWGIVNLDAMLIAQAPRFAPHIPQMKIALSRPLGLDPGRVSIKATTSERLGFTGRGEGIAAMAVAMIARISGVS